MWLEVRGGGEESQVQLGGLAGIGTAAAALYSTVKLKASLQFITGMSPSCWPMLTVASGSEDSGSSSRPSAASRACTTSTDQLTNQTRPTSQPTDLYRLLQSRPPELLALAGLGGAGGAGRRGGGAGQVAVQHRARAGTGHT